MQEQSDVVRNDRVNFWVLIRQMICILKRRGALVRRNGGRKAFIADRLVETAEIQVVFLVCIPISDLRVVVREGK